MNKPPRHGARRAFCRQFHLAIEFHEAETRQARSRSRKAQQQVVHKLEKQIQELEARQTELTAKLETPETYERPLQAVSINRELAGVQEDLSTLTAQWEAEATKLAAMD